MNKYLIYILLSASFLITGCQSQNTTLMDQLSDDGNYHYTNADAGFSLVLPREFIYYQVYRKYSENFSDIEILVPTSDENIMKEMANYVKPITIRVFDAKFWDDNNPQNQEYKALYEKVGDKNGKIYTIRFWSEIPSDWKDKWSDEMKNFIKSNFKLI